MYPIIEYSGILFLQLWVSQSLLFSKVGQLCQMLVNTFQWTVWIEIEV